MTEPSAPSRSTLLSTASSVLAGYNAWSIPAILAPRSATCTQEILPHTLRIPSMNNDEYATYFAPSLPVFRNFTVKAHETIVDEEARKVVMLASSTAETDIGPYSNEYVLVIKMGRDGRQAEKVIEWVDSGYAIKYFGKLRQAADTKNKETESSSGEQKL
ncbi:MAG: hypothetical protein Q9195_001363 [Heterodermia aff. obscurata]